MSNNAAIASNPRAKVAELSEKVVDTNPYSRLMCACSKPPRLLCQFLLAGAGTAGR